MSPHDTHFTYVMEMFQLFLKVAQDMVIKTQNHGIPPQVCHPSIGQTLEAKPTVEDFTSNCSINQNITPPSTTYNVPGSASFDKQMPSTTNSTPGSSSQDALLETTPLADNVFDNYYLPDDGLMDMEILRPDDGSWFFPINDTYNTDPNIWYNPNPNPHP